jgi:hypothetical protein
MSFSKVILVTKETPYSQLLARHSTPGQAKFVLDQSGGRFSDYLSYHDAYHRALDAVRAELRGWGGLAEVDARLLPSYLFHPEALVVTLGPDGLVANTAKYLEAQPIFAVNPDPSTIDGVLARHSAAMLRSYFAAPEAFKVQNLSMAEARISDGQVLLGVNDLFIGSASHASARYELVWNGRFERQSSSGVIVSTGTGSTGWRRSMFAGVAGFLEGEGEYDLASTLRERYSFPPEERRLAFAVREPFASQTTSASLVVGSIVEGEELEIRSEMPHGGVIFSDGVEADFLGFGAGMVARIGLAERVAKLVAPKWRAARSEDAPPSR